MFKVEFTEDEYKFLVSALDVTVKSVGLQAAAGALQIVSKLNEAANVKTKDTDSEG